MKKFKIYLASLLFFPLIMLMHPACFASIKDKKPNIILIVTDDQEYADLSAYKHALANCSTPNMDRIAKNGVLLTNAHASVPVCSPSRAGMLAGKYQERWDRAMYWSPGLPENVRTLAEILKAEAGYTTARIGKNDFGKNFHNPHAREFPSNHGYDYFLLDEDIEKTTPDPYGWSEALGRLFRDTAKESFKNTHTTELFTDEAISFIRKNKDRPFFLDLSWEADHKKYIFQKL